MNQDGTRLVTAGWDGAAIIWDTRPGRALTEIKGDKSKICVADLSPDGQFVVVGGNGLHFNYLECRNRKKSIQDWKKQPAAVCGVKYSPGGKKILATYCDDLVIVWDVETGRKNSTFSGPMGEVAFGRFNKNGKFIITGGEDKTAKVWNLETGHLIYSLLGHTHNVTSGLFDIQNRFIITSSKDGSLKFWDEQTGKELLTYYSIREKEWIAIHPSGLFDASPGALAGMYYLIGQEIIEFEQLKERYYEPGLMQKALGYDDGELRDVEQFGSLALYPKINAVIQNSSLIIELQERKRRHRQTQPVHQQQRSVGGCQPRKKKPRFRLICLSSINILFQAKQTVFH